MVQYVFVLRLGPFPFAAGVGGTPVNLFCLKQKFMFISKQITEVWELMERLSLKHGN